MECPLCIREEGWIDTIRRIGDSKISFFFRNPWLRPLLLPLIKPIDLHSPPFCIDRFHFRSGIWGCALKWREGHLCVWEIKSQASSSLPRLRLFVEDLRRLCSRLTQKHFKIYEPFLLTIFRTVYSSIQKIKQCFKKQTKCIVLLYLRWNKPSSPPPFFFCFFALIRSGVKVTFFFSSFMFWLQKGEERREASFLLPDSEKRRRGGKLRSRFSLLKSIGKLVPKVLSFFALDRAKNCHTCIRSISDRSFFGLGIVGSGDG